MLKIKNFFPMLKDWDEYLIVIPQLNHQGHMEIIKLVNHAG